MTVDALRKGSPLRAAEFFARVGLVRMGLERAGVVVPWSNDIEAAKQAMYLNHFGSTGADHEYVLGDIAFIRGEDLPAGLSLAWASSPCTDLSLAGNRVGLGPDTRIKRGETLGQASATFWHFIRILAELGADRPPVVVLENVTGFATSHRGQDLTDAIRALNLLGYSADVLAIDAVRFVPQSRPRLFVVGALQPPAAPARGPHPFRPEWLTWVFESPDLRTHKAVLPAVRGVLDAGLDDIVEALDGDDPRWWDPARVGALLDSLSPLQLGRVNALKLRTTLTHRTAYRRTRQGVAVWEIRRDSVAGCLRTARGGSSKQALVEVGANSVRVRWMTPVEYARLMGAGDYRLEGMRSNQALFGFGDAVCVPVVEWLATSYLVPLIEESTGTLSQQQVSGG